ncbi:MICOS complex subunit Mic60-like [Maniola jurtina]|uniref:MICOS complex subunit Mic60-like n=1 Tax=Maniola jurtina TaxID=191418 RepID=UPI001E68D688|nr:MICOS complex subunit Mic60-like [Maniola jurtina]
MQDRRKKCMTVSNFTAMFRINTILWTARSLLRYRYLEVRTASVSRCMTSQNKVQVRDPCPPPPPPPPPKPKDDSAFWAAMAVVFVAGGFVVIAKRSPEIRDWLTIHAPWFDDIIAVAYEENYTYGEFAQRCLEDLKSYLKIVMKNEPCPPEGAPKPAITVPTEAEVEAEKEGKNDDTEDGESCVKPPPIVVRKTACEILERLKERGNEALSNYYTAHRACLLYNQIVDDTMQNFSIKTMKELHGHLEERVKLVTEAVEKAKEATANIEELTRYIDCGVMGPKDEVENLKILMKDYLQQIEAANIQYTWEDDKSKVLDVQWQKVESTIDKYSEENQTMFPEINYEQKKLQLSGDTDLLLHHTSRYTRQLKAELNDVVEGMTERVNRAYEMLPQGEKERKERDAMVQSVLKQKRAEMDKEFSKRYADQREKNDNILKDSLRKQLERHQDTLEKRLVEKEKEATRKLDKLVAERVAYEKNQFAIELKEMAMKLALIQDKLKACLKIERETRRSQDLWVAGASLLAATKKGDPYVNVDKELRAIERASGDGDKLVTTVLQAIPRSVREQGLVPESVLKDRYHQMEDIALKVALVEQEGASFPVYILSWLQSALLFMKLSGIPQKEIDNPPKEPPYKELDTFELLQRARFWMERGNLSNAIRYISALEGASRAAALSWHDAARSHVETRQAAEAILAHAVALGLQYI